MGKGKETFTGGNGIVNGNETQSVDKKITEASTETQQQVAVLDGVTEADILEIKKNPERNMRLLKNLEALKSKLKAIEKYLPVIAAALVAITALIGAFAMDADIESSKIQISNILAGAGTALGMFALGIYTWIKNKEEKYGPSATPQHA